jgi:hypothetical protein
VEQLGPLGLGMVGVPAPVSLEEAKVLLEGAEVSLEGIEVSLLRVWL